MSRRLARPDTAGAVQQQTFRSLLAQISLTAYGRDLDIDPAMKYAEFRSRVPVRDYDQLEPYLQRIRRGDTNVLWPGACLWTAQSAGTTAHPKWLPHTADSVHAFETAEAASLLYYCARVDHCDVLNGRQLALNRSLALTPFVPGRRDAPPASSATVFPLPASPAWGAPDQLEPDAATLQLTDWNAKVAAIVARTLTLDISLMAGLPNWLIVFAEVLRQSAREKNLPADTLKSIWPKLECIVHHGVPIAPFQDELKRTAGTGVNLHEVYFAAEAFIAAQDADAGSGLRLIDDGGVFFEFLPLAEFHDALPLTMGPKAVALDEIKVDENYVLLLTTPAGLCRYVLGDIVRFVSTEPARLVYVGRTKQRLNAFAENLLEKELTDAIALVCQRHNWTITNFHVAPLFSSSLIGHTHGRHEWWVELRPGTAETPTGPILAAHLDVELRSRSSSYAERRRTGALDAPVVRLVMPGFFAQWMQQQNRWGGHRKMPRCQPDRRIADQLSAIACFNAD